MGPRKQVPFVLDFGHKFEWGRRAELYLHTGHTISKYKVTNAVSLRRNRPLKSPLIQEISLPIIVRKDGVQATLWYLLTSFQTSLLVYS